MEIFIVVVTFLIGINLGWNAREMHAKQQVEKLFSELSQEPTEDLIRIKIEQENGMLFAYHEENSVFIAQANTREKLEKQLAVLYPDKKFGCTTRNLKECGFIQ